MSHSGTVFDNDCSNDLDDVVSECFISKLTTISTKESLDFGKGIFNWHIVERIRRKKQTKMTPICSLFVYNVKRVYLDSKDI